MRHISQREAHRLRKRVEALERAEQIRNQRWGAEYPGGVHLDTLSVNAAEWHIIDTARKLGHACIVIAAPTKPNEYPVFVYGLKP